jgi:ribosomal-protein-alanine N-acetyltransferase
LASRHLCDIQLFHFQDTISAATVIQTQRLQLVNATLRHFDAELESLEAISRLLGARVLGGWPPGEYDRQAIDFFRTCVIAHPESAEWYSWYAIERGPVNSEGILIGAAGYFGPPSKAGIVEIGYSIVPGFRGRGYASEIVEALVGRAFSYPSVSRIIAHVKPENGPSVRVLERCGFVLAGQDVERELVRYERESKNAQQVERETNE